mmetsp:Transcript_71939/g.186818  ORF Transcript_71939/g.186818 Transcript_71939/m.186818 type:complete len:256 (-) Transcript_71939:89-856(-)
MSGSVPKVRLGVYTGQPLWYFKMRDADPDDDEYDVPDLGPAVADVSIRGAVVSPFASSARPAVVRTMPEPVVAKDDNNSSQVGFDDSYLSEDSEAEGAALRGWLKRHEAKTFGPKTSRMINSREVDMDYFKEMEPRHDEAPPQADADIPWMKLIEKSSVVNTSGCLPNSFTQSTMDSLGYVSRTMDELGPTSISMGELPTSSVLAANENLAVASANERSYYAIQTSGTLREDVHGEIEHMPWYDTVRIAQQTQPP